MPATVESPPSSSEQQTRRDSAFYSSSEDSNADMERIKRDNVMSRSAEHLRRRRDSVDSGAGEMEPHYNPIAFHAPGVSSAFKRSSSGSSIRRSKGSDHQLNLSEQMHLLLQKMAVLEQKLISMDSKLKEEQLQRLTLEAKVIKLEEANEKLKDTRTNAHSQLKDFADKFYAMDSGSPVPSPHPSVTELRFRSRTDSVSSSGSSRSSKVSSYRLSGISI